MLHGWGASLYMYRHAFARLPRFGVRVIAVDLRGHGLSDKPRAPGSYSLDAYRRDLSALLEALGIGRCALVGQSMGGGLALRHAQGASHQISKVVLINPTGLVAVRALPLLRVPPAWLLDGLGRRAVPRWLIGAILRRVAYGDASLVTERDVDEYWAPTQLDGFIHAARAAISEFDWRPLRARESAEFATPALVILGRADRLVRNARPAAERLADCRVVELAGGHCVNEEQPDETYDAVGEFLR